jgi:uncharacterized membrane protein YdjX (TVP38/TMEM64 family)
MKRKKSINYILIGGLVFWTSYFITKYINRLPRISIENLRSYILSYGKFSVIIFLILYTIKPVIIILPTVLLSILAGSIYKPVSAIALTITGCVLSATSAFCIARLVGRNFVERLFKGKLINLDKNIGERGFKIMLIMRLSVVFPYDTLSFAAGLTSMNYLDFILGTTIGTVPEAIAYSLLGENLKNPLSLKFLAPFLGISICALTFSSILKYERKKDNS